MQINLTKTKLRENELGLLGIQQLLSFLSYAVACYNVYFNVNRIYSLNKLTPLSGCSSKSYP